MNRSISGRSNSFNGNGVKRGEAHYKDFSRQATYHNPRLTVLNTAVELLKTHRRPMELAEVISLASQRETWALS
jgi:hypothetical protein